MGINITKRYWHSLFVIILVFAAVSCSKDIIDLNGSIKGVIKDYSTGALISNCQVVITPGGKSMLTGPDGMYEFSDLTPGSYTITFSKAGYDEASRTVTVISGETSSVDMSLKAKSAFSASSNKLDFGDLSSTQEVYFFNNSDETVSFTISSLPSWVSVSKATGTVAAGSNLPVSFAVNRDAVEYGTYTQVVSVDYQGKTNGTISITIQMQKVKLSAPIVKINVAAEDVTQTSFSIQGELVATGGAEISSYGHCWALTQNPTIDNYKSDNGATTNIGTFKSSATNLTPGTTYYVRAYAINQYGTSYSEQIAVTTQDVASDKWDGNIAKSFAGGNGTMANPYIIKTGGQLLLMKDFSNKYFELANNINLDNKNWLPFGFSGNLNGKGFVISNLKVDRETDNQGLFSRIVGGTVQNLTIKNVNINALNYSGIGALAGELANWSSTGSVISNCHVILTGNSKIAGNAQVGGLFGSFTPQQYSSGGDSSIENCTVEYSGTSTDVILGNHNVGGLVGSIGRQPESVKVKITSCQVFANIKGSDYVGGIVGGYYGSMIKQTLEKSAFKGTISGDKYVGGLVGDIFGDIISCKADVDLTVNSSYGGGIVGLCSTGNIICCYTTGIIKSTSNSRTLGGIQGDYSGGGYGNNVQVCYSTIISSNSYFDGLAGSGDCKYSACTASTRYSGTNKGKCRDITTFIKELYQNGDYWNFNNIWTWTGTIDGDQVNVSCPRLAWE